MPIPSPKGLPVTELSADEAIFHALNRLAYGQRPGDLERIKQMGLAKWVDQQLNPGSINDSAVEARLNVYPTLGMSTAQLIAEYPNPKQAAKQAGLSKEEFKTQQIAQKQARCRINGMRQRLGTPERMNSSADASFAHEAKSHHSRCWPQRFT